MKKLLLATSLAAALALPAYSAVSGFESLTAPVPGGSTVGTAWTVNSQSCCSNPVSMTTTTLTFPGGYNSGSAFANTTQTVTGNWTSTFSFTNLGDSLNDGNSLQFTLQKDSRGATAIDVMNGNGGSIGREITPAYSVVFMNNKVGFMTNGTYTQAFAAAATPTGLSFLDDIDVTLTYNGTTLGLSMSDGVTTFNATPQSVSLSTILGASTGYVGFSTFNNGGGDFVISDSNLMVTAAIPEPSTAAMLIGGFALLMALRRRRA